MKDCNRFEHTHTNTRTFGYLQHSVLESTKSGVSRSTSFLLFDSDADLHTYILYSKWTKDIRQFPGAPLLELSNVQHYSKTKLIASNLKFKIEIKNLKLKKK